MLSNNILATPRPRPPAKARRTPSLQLKSSPPPPYRADAYPNPGDKRSLTPLRNPLLGSPIDMASHMLNWDGENARGGRPSPVPEDWMNEKSRGELTELFHKADDLIKERENELGLTSAVCKNLYETNMSLKNKHDALLARIPSQSPSFSPANSNSSPPHTPHYYSASLESLPDMRTLSRQPSNVSLGRPTHSRRVSMSPSDLALLSDQNAELMQKLEKLEFESAQADQAGRRKLRKLEKEIQTLRDELDQTQARSEELEEQAKSGLNADEIWRRREEREDRLRALRGKSGGDDDDASDVRDFAPGGALANLSSPGLPASVTAKVMVSPAPDDDVSSSLGGEAANSSPSFTPRASLSRTRSPAENELGLISQLLLKIRELEETNAQISSQQYATVAKLHSAQKDAESMSRVYDYLGDKDGVEFVVDGDDQDEGPPLVTSSSSKTIRFRSLRRSLDLNLSKLMADNNEDVFGGEIGQQSTVRSGGAINFTTSLSSKKNRKSVVGLFDDPDAVPSQSRTQDFASYRSRLSQPPASLSKYIRPASPTLSALSISNTPGDAPAPSPIGGSGHTLESELGSQFGDDWGAYTENHRLRSNSLYDLSHVNTEASHPSSPTPSMSQHAQAIPPPIARDASLRETRYQRLSQTVRSRTSQWVDGRFKDTLLSFTKQGPKPAPVIPAMQGKGKDPAVSSTSLVGTFNSSVEQFTGPPPSKRATIATSDEVDLSSVVEPELRSGSQVELSQDDKQGQTSFVLELWLWLQFIIIILAFLWAVTKRGPRNVLAEAERRRAAAAASRRRT